MPEAYSMFLDHFVLKLLPDSFEGASTYIKSGLVAIGYCRLVADTKLFIHFLKSTRHSAIN